jgi:hypothetical protein
METPATEWSCFSSHTTHGNDIALLIYGYLLHSSSEPPGTYMTKQYGRVILFCWDEWSNSFKFSSAFFVKKSTCLQYCNINLYRRLALVHSQFVTKYHCRLLAWNPVASIEEMWFSVYFELPSARQGARLWMQVPVALPPSKQVWILLYCLITCSIYKEKLSVVVWYIHYTHIQ